MISLTVLCNKCGRRMQRTVDEYCPPTCVHCVCGARFPLSVDEEEPRLRLPAWRREADGLSCEDDGSSEAELLRLVQGDKVG